MEARSATRTTYNGYEALKTGNVYLRVTKDDKPPVTESGTPQGAAPLLERRVGPVLRWRARGRPKHERKE